MKKSESSPSVIFSLCILAAIAAIFTLGMAQGIPTAALLIVILIMLFCISVLRKIPYAGIEEAMMRGIKQGIGAIVILLIVGIIISTWIQCGVVPMIIYYGLGFLDAKFLLPLTFILCTIVSVCTGSSWSACGTLGLACVSIGQSMGIPVYIVVGAAISGATVGDKLSPFSDTTVFAAGITDVNIYKHIKAMMYTTVPTFVLSLIIFTVIGFLCHKQALDVSMVGSIRDALAENFHFHPILLILPIMILLMSLFKLPAVLSLLFSGLLGGIFAVSVQGVSVNQVLTGFYSGYVADTGIEMIDLMLSKGGLLSMLPTVCIIILAMGVGGIISEMGILTTLINSIKHKIKTDENMVILTLFCGILMVLALSSLYVTAVLIKEVFVELYDERGLDRSVLSRAIEESTTITTPLIPWHSSYIYYTDLFQLTTMQFVPYTIFCWLNLIVSITMLKTRILKPVHRDKDTVSFGKQEQEEAKGKSKHIKSQANA